MMSRAPGFATSLSPRGMRPSLGTARREVP